LVAAAEQRSVHAPDDGVYIIEVAGIGGVDQTGHLHRDPRRDEPAVPGGGTVNDATLGGGLAQRDDDLHGGEGGGAVARAGDHGRHGQWVQSGFAPGTTYRGDAELSQYIFSPARLDFDAFADDELLRHFVQCTQITPDPHTLR